jgi:hypothetical protein
VLIVPMDAFGISKRPIIEKLHEGARLLNVVQDMYGITHLTSSPLTDFANKIPVRVYGINVKPNDDQLSAVKTPLWRYRHDGDDDTFRDVDPYSATSPTKLTHRVFDVAAKKWTLQSSLSSFTLCWWRAR